MRANVTHLMIALIIGAAVLICGCTVPSGNETTNQTNGTPARAAASTNLTIEQVLVQDGNFSTLLLAIDTAGLEGAYSGPGPYTVFAPTDDVFRRVPSAVMEGLFNDPKGSLAEVLLYHMAPGSYTASDIATIETIETVQGSPIAVDTAGDRVWVNGAEIVRTEIPATNGIIHVIDAVMVPPGVILTATDVTPVETGSVTNTTGTTNITGRYLPVDAIQ